MNKKEIEMEEDITFAEFKAWMNGMIYGRRHNLPDSTDWKLIKQMMERVVPDKVEIQNPAPWPTIPTPVVPYTDPYTPPTTDKWEITCSGSVDEPRSFVGGLTIGDMSGGDYGTCSQSSGHINSVDFGISNESCLPQGSLLPCPQVAIGNTEESLTPALDKARVLLKQVKDEPKAKNSPRGHKFDTSKYIIQDAVDYSLENIAELLGVKK